MKGYCGGGGGAAEGQSNKPSALCGESCSESAREVYGPPSSFVTSQAADWLPMSQSVNTEGATGGVVISVAMLFPDTASVIVEDSGLDDATGAHGEPTP